MEKDNYVSILFEGPHGYISPKLYSHPEKSVPTWNYSTVMVNGEAKIVEDKEWLYDLVIRLTAKYEKDEDYLNSVNHDDIKRMIPGI